MSGSAAFGESISCGIGCRRASNRLCAVADMLKRLMRLALDPFPIRRTSLRIARGFAKDDFKFRYSHGLFDRPHYAYIMFEGAKLAKSLGHSKISTVEFGVAGGAGLLAMERLA